MTTLVKSASLYEEVIDFIAAGTTPESVIEFQLSDAAKERLEDTIYRLKTEGLSPDEKIELERFLAIEHIMRLAKAKARKLIQSSQSE